MRHNIVEWCQKIFKIAVFEILSTNTNIYLYGYKIHKVKTLKNLVSCPQYICVCVCVCVALVSSLTPRLLLIDIPLRAAYQFYSVFLLYVSYIHISKCLYL